MPVQLARKLRPDMMGSWLPFALSSVFVLVASALCKAPPSQAEVLESWGLDDLADDMRRSGTERALEECFGGF